MNTTLSHIILFCLLFLTSCSGKNDLQIECFDKSGELVYKVTKKRIILHSTDEQDSKFSKCVITEVKGK